MLEAATDTLRTMVVRPGVVYGGGSGMVGDIFKSATNGLVRVVGDGSNRWPLVYDRDLADLYAKLAVNQDASGIYHANDEGDERVNDIVSAISPYLPVRPDVRHVPIEEARTKMGPVRRRAGARSGRQKSARAGARLDADAAFRRRQCRAAARRVARVEGLTSVNTELRTGPLRSPRKARSSTPDVLESSADDWPFNRRTLQVVGVGARQQIEERIEAAIERAAELGNRAVDGVKRHVRRSSRPLSAILASSRPLTDPSGINRTP